MSTPRDGFKGQQKDVYEHSLIDHTALPGIVSSADLPASFVARPTWEQLVAAGTLCYTDQWEPESMFPYPDWVWRWASPPCALIDIVGATSGTFTLLIGSTTDTDELESDPIPFDVAPEDIGLGVVVASARSAIWEVVFTATSGLVTLWVTGNSTIADVFAFNADLAALQGEYGSLADITGSGTVLDPFVFDFSSGTLADMVVHVSADGAAATRVQSGQPASNVPMLSNGRRVIGGSLYVDKSADALSVRLGSNDTDGEVSVRAFPEPALVSAMYPGLFMEREGRLFFYEDAAFSDQTLTGSTEPDWQTTDPDEHTTASDGGYNGWLDLGPVEDWPTGPPVVMEPNSYYEAKQLLWAPDGGDGWLWVASPNYEGLTTGGPYEMFADDSRSPLSDLIVNGGYSNGGVDGFPIFLGAVSPPFTRPWSESERRLFTIDQDMDSIWPWAPLGYRVIDGYFSVEWVKAYTNTWLSVQLL